MLKRTARLAVVVILALAGVGLTLASLSANGSAAEQCVAPGGAGGCFATIQEALDAVDASGTVRVMTGVYVENLIIDRDVTMIGGFDDTSFSSQTARSSIIDGNRLGSVIKVMEGVNATIEGFTITGGDATSDMGQGGGIFVHKASAMIMDNLIEDNVANSSAARNGGIGGGIAVSEGTGAVMIRDNTIRANRAYSISATTPVTFGIGWGGGIGLENDESTTIIGNLIAENRAVQTNIPMPVIGMGGGIGSYSSARIAIVDNNVIQDNIANVTNGAGNGGGVNLYHAGNTTIADNEIIRNTAVLSGDFATGGGIFVRLAEAITLTNNYIGENVASQSGHDGQGGGVLINSSNRGSGQLINMVGNQIVGNIAAIDVAATPGNSRPYVSGGGVRIWGGDADDEHVILRDNYITDNIAVSKFVLAAEDDDGYVQGGGITIERVSHTEIISNHVENNIAILNGTIDDGGGVSGGGIHLGEVETVMVSANRIISNTTADDLTASTHRFNIYGGGLAVVNTDDISITHNTLANNTGLRVGEYADLEAASFPNGGGLYISCWSRPTCAGAVEKNRIAANVTLESATTGPTHRPYPQGGGLSINDSIFIVQDNWIENNNSYLTGDFGSSGGAISVGSSEITLQRNIVINNNTGQRDDGEPVVSTWESTLSSRNNLYISNSGGATGSGPSPDQMSQFDFVNDTFADNGEIGIKSGSNSTVTVHNTIIAGHETGITMQDSSSAISGDYNLLSNDTNYGSGITPGAHDLIDVEPSFVGGGDYHLAGGSPGIDAGLNSIAPPFDIDKDERPIDGNLDGNARADIGADEFAPANLYLPAVFAE